MNLQKKRRRRKIIAKIKGAFTDIIAITVCLFGAGVAFFFFWKDLNKSLTKLNEAPIANVHFKKNTAQRRFGDRVVWDVLRETSPVYNADVIHTSNMSEAEILYFDESGNEESGFYLDQNSLIQVFSDRIELANGKINIHTRTEQTRLKLVSAGTIIDIGENSMISVNSAEAGGGNIQVVEGTATIITAEGTQETKAGEALVVRADGKRQVVPQVVLLTPKQNESIAAGLELASPDVAGQNFVRFSWRTSNFSGEDFVRFEVASDQRFSRIVQTADVRDSNEQTAALGAGTYWWRAYPVKDGGAAADSMAGVSNKFNILEFTAPKPLTPSEGAVVHYAAAQQDENAKPPAVRLQWTDSIPEAANSGAGAGYLVEVSNDTGFQNPVFKQEVYGQNFVAASNLNNGRWYWRVKPILQGGGAVGGNAGGSDIVSKTASFSLERSSAQLSAPVLQSPANGAALNLANGMAFSWQAGTQVASYTLQISRESDFVEPELSRKILSNFISLNTSNAAALSDGVWYWRVAANAADSASPWSQTRSLNISTTKPPVELLYPRDGWPVSEAAYYGATFSWKFNADSGAAAARLQISADEKFGSLSADKPVSGTEVTAPALSAGTYFWRILTATGGESYATPPRRFTINGMARIVLEAPADSAEIDGATALRNPPELRWSAIEALKNSRLYLSTSSNIQGEPPAGASKPILDIANPARSVKLPQLSEGVYYWIVYGESQNGVNISATRAYSFKITAASLLTATTLNTPRNNSVLDAEFLRKNRGINFGWRSVPEANAYILSIYRGAANRGAPIFQSAPIRQNSFNFTRLELLDIGTFTWQVEPVFVSESNNIEQHGTTREATLRVEITMPKSDTAVNEETFGF